MENCSKIVKIVFGYILGITLLTVLILSLNIYILYDSSAALIIALALLIVYWYSFSSLLSKTIQPPAWIYNFPFFTNPLLKLIHVSISPFESK